MGIPETHQNHIHGNFVSRLNSGESLLLLSPKSFIFPSPIKEPNDKSKQNNNFIGSFTRV